MTALSLAEIRAKAEAALFPPPGGERHTAGCVFAATRAKREAPPRRPGITRASQERAARAERVRLDLTAAQVLEMRDRLGSWQAVAKEIPCVDQTLRNHLRRLRIDSGKRLMHSDAEMVAAYRAHGSFNAAAVALGVTAGGSFIRRVRRILAGLR